MRRRVKGSEDKLIDFPLIPKFISISTFYTVGFGLFKLLKSISSPSSSQALRGSVLQGCHVTLSRAIYETLTTTTFSSACVSY